MPVSMPRPQLQDEADPCARDAFHPRRRSTARIPSPGASLSTDCMPGRRGAPVGASNTFLRATCESAPNSRDLRRSKRVSGSLWGDCRRSTRAPVSRRIRSADHPLGDLGADMIHTQPRAVAALSAIALATLGAATSGALASVSAAPVAGTVSTGPATSAQGLHPAVSDFVQVSTSTTPPTEAQCYSVGRRCFTPTSTRAAYNVQSLIDRKLDGRGMTIAIVDSHGSDTMAHDLHVYDRAFGLPPMCGEEGVRCAAGMPTFSELHLQGSPATKAPPSTSKGTGLQDKSAWALEVALDVETAHSMAPGANILLVTTPNSETLGVQGFPQMMAAEQYVVDHHLANVISQSFASAEDAFGSSKSLENLRHAYVSAAQAGITVLGSTGDSGTANVKKTPVGGPNANQLIPFPSVEWPASDPLVTAVGGTYLCT